MIKINNIRNLTNYYPLLYSSNFFHITFWYHNEIIFCKRNASVYSKTFLSKNSENLVLSIVYYLQTNKVKKLNYYKDIYT